MIALLRKTLRLGMLGGIGYGVWKTIQSRRTGHSWDVDSWVSTGAKGATTVPAAAPVPTGRSNGEATPLPASSPAVEQAAPVPEAAAPPASEAPAPEAPASETGAPRPVPGRPPKPSGGTGPGRKAAAPGKAHAPPGERLWVVANEGVCPPSHPVKAKLASKIFHVPGGRNYSRTHADRCYPDETSAQSDGLRPAMR